MRIIKKSTAAASFRVVVSEPLPGDQFWPMKLPYAEARRLSRVYCRAASAVSAAVRFRSVVKEVNAYLQAEQYARHRTLSVG